MTWRIVIAALVAVTAGATAQADGFFAARFDAKQVGRSTTPVSSHKQEALLATDGTRVQVILRTHFRAEPEELAWVVPVPARPTDIKPADDALFARLDDLTAPRFVKFVPSNGPNLSFGCSAGEMSTAAVAPAVQVEERGTAGIFEYTVLAATGAGELETWLKDNGYRLPPGAAETLAHYVGKGWHWLAMKVRTGGERMKPLAPHPISYTYESAQVVFPLIISRLSAERENELVVYLVGAEPFICRNWMNATSTDVGWATELPGSPSGTDYEQRLRQSTAHAGGHVFVSEFSQAWEVFGTQRRGRRIDGAVDARIVDVLGGRQCLTRLRAFVLPENMDRDVEFKPDDRDLPTHNRLRPNRPLTPTAGVLGAGLASLPLVFLVLAAPLAAAAGRRTRTILCLLLGVGLAML